jgi:ubiquinone/menaquinone biosynthesis C-methylase UbiE
MPYYRSHWVTIETERLERYDQFFQWQPQMEPMLEGLPLAQARNVVDYGCGPGWVALEIARRAPRAAVIGCDINADFLDRARRHASESGLEDRVEWHHIEKDEVPVADGAADVVFCKNVLEYVDSMDATLREFHRVLKPGGVARLIDSDWDMMVIEPLGAERVSELWTAAGHAYNDRQAGRHLYGSARRAGFSDVHVRMASICDTEGFFRPMIMSVASYATEGGGLDSKEGEAFMRDIEAAIERHEYMAVLPQFIVTAVA